MVIFNIHAPAKLNLWKSVINPSNLRKMCILFMNVGTEDNDSDYSLILASNRDESYDRPTQKMGAWTDDPNIIGGRDLEAGGTWLAISPLRRKLGVLLNLPRVKRSDAKSRGKIVEDYMKSCLTTKDYIDCIQSYIEECNEFVFVTIELGKKVTVQTYTNATNDLKTWEDHNLSFGNNLPETPLVKVKAGKQKMDEICSTFNKITMKTELINELIGLLKSDYQHLPDPELENRRPEIYKELSSIFVNIPQGRYGTRTHTIVLVTKTGHVDVVEVNLQSPIDLSCPKWETTEFHFDIPTHDIKQGL